MTAEVHPEYEILVPNRSNVCPGGAEVGDGPIVDVAEVAIGPLLFPLVIIP